MNNTLRRFTQLVLMFLMGSVAGFQFASTGTYGFWMTMFVIYLIFNFFIDSYIEKMRLLYLHSLEDKVQNIQKNLKKEGP